VVRSSWRTAHAPLASLRHHFCLDHRLNALLLQTELVAEAAARRYASPTGPAVLPFPFVLPDDLLPRLGYPWNDRLVALHWDAAGDVLCIAGRHWVRVPRSDAGLWFALVRKPAVALWLREHLVCLGSRDREASHALLLDRHRMKAVVARVAQAHASVVARATSGGHAPPAAGTPKGGL
jgi:hypothetical protein